MSTKIRNATITIPEVSIALDKDGIMAVIKDYFGLKYGPGDYYAGEPLRCNGKEIYSTYWDGPHRDHLVTNVASENEVDIQKFQALLEIEKILKQFG